MVHRTLLLLLLLLRVSRVLCMVLVLARLILLRILVLMSVLPLIVLTWLLARLLRRRARFIAPQVTVRQSRDPADDKFLECALAGQAHYVVSADEDLLSVGESHGIPIVDVPTFWRALQEYLLQSE